MDSQTSPNLTREEVKHAIKISKSNKAPGPDEVSTELIKLVMEEPIDILVDLYNTIYNTGIIPTEWLKLTYIVLPEIPNAKKCLDHQTISLMSHTQKYF